MISLSNQSAFRQAISSLDRILRQFPWDTEVAIAASPGVGKSMLDQPAMRNTPRSPTPLGEGYMSATSMCVQLCGDAVGRFGGGK